MGVMADRAEAVLECGEKGRQGIGFVYEGHAAARTAHSGGKADPAVEGGCGHGVGGAFQGVAGRGAAGVVMVGRIGKDVIEAFRRQRGRIGFLGRGGHIAGDDRDASLETIAVNVAASEVYEDGFAFDEGDAGVRAAHGDAEADGADAGATIQDRGLRQVHL